MVSSSRNFTHKLPELQQNTALNVELDYHCRDSSLYYLNHINQDKEQVNKLHEVRIYD